MDKENGKVSLENILELGDIISQKGKASY